jgi:2-methylisocitrate lyase-like PEP mutase family enzyme
MPPGRPPARTILIELVTNGAEREIMTDDRQRTMAETFLEMHHGGMILLLANAWNVGSAKVFEQAGFRAIGTTSAGIANSLGHRDGQRMSLEDNLRVVCNIAGRVSVPVNADIEAGYASDPQGAAEAARRALKAGAVGINLEDGTGESARPLVDTALHAAKIKAVRKMASEEQIRLVVNARIDVYLSEAGDPGSRFDATVARARAYVEAGADCVFVPDFGGLDQETVRRLVAAIDAPLNILAGAHLPPISELQKMGVRRVSLGARPARAALAFLRRMARELVDEGTYSLMTDDALSGSEINGWFAP